MAHKKGVGSTDNGRDSKSKRLGVKLFGGQFAKAGNIIIRQRGTKYHPGNNVYMGKDFTLHAQIDGFVDFRTKKMGRTYVNILPDLEEVKETVAKIEKTKKAAPAPKKTESAAKKAAPKSAGGADDLKKIEGIGPKTAEHFNNAGINTFAELAKTSVDKLQTILDNAGKRYSIINPSTFPMQAELAAQGKWDELTSLKDRINNGKLDEEE